MKNVKISAPTLAPKLSLKNRRMSEADAAVYDVTGIYIRHPVQPTAPAWRRVSLWRLVLAMIAVAAYLAFAYFLVLA